MLVEDEATNADLMGGGRSDFLRSDCDSESNVASVWYNSGTSVENFVADWGDDFSRTLVLQVPLAGVWHRCHVSFFDDVERCFALFSTLRTDFL